MLDLLLVSKLFSQKVEIIFWALSQKNRDLCAHNISYQTRKNTIPCSFFPEKRKEKAAANNDHERQPSLKKSAPQKDKILYDKESFEEQGFFKDIRTTNSDHNQNKTTRSNR